MNQEVFISEAEIPDQRMPATRLLVRAGLSMSLGEARRLLNSGAIRIGPDMVTDAKAQIPITDGLVVQNGRRHVAIKLTG